MKLSAHNEKNLVYFAIVIVSLFIFLVFYKNQDFLFASESVSQFTAYAALALGLMMVLVYMVSNRKETTHHKKSPSKKRRR